MFVNKLPRYEILSPDAVETLERGWKRIVSELGVEFLLPEAVELFAKAGMKTEGDNVWLDPDFILEQVAKAPRSFDVQARNPANNVHIGDDRMVFSSVYGPPFVRQGDVRRDATHGRLPQLREARALVPRARHDRRHDRRAQRHAARLAPPRHGAGAADALRQGLHGLGHVGPERGRHDPHDRDPARRPRGDREDAGRRSR